MTACGMALLLTISDSNCSRLTCSPTVRLETSRMRLSHIARCCALKGTKRGGKGDNCSTYVEDF